MQVLLQKLYKKVLLLLNLEYSAKNRHRVRVTQAMRKTVVVDDGVSNLPLESTQSPFLMTLSDSLFFIRETRAKNIIERLLQ